jgi:hypothetical protein
MTAVLQGIQKNQTTVCQTVSYIWWLHHTV